jgi:hypothetical protein
MAFEEKNFSGLDCGFGKTVFNLKVQLQLNFCRVLRDSK